jgi:soluble lytic murein transglycosylase-like protein
MIPTSVIQWQSTAEKYAAVYPVLNANEILAIIWSESSGNPKAINPHDPSYGLMQVTIAIGRKFSPRVTTPTDLMDPDTNVEAGSGFLAHLKSTYAERFPGYKWIQAYNCGEGNLLKGFDDSKYSDAVVSHLNELNGGTNVVNP